jgi:hypothetical protein
MGAIRTEDHEGVAQLAERLGLNYRLTSADPAVPRDNVLAATFRATGLETVDPNYSTHVGVVKAEDGTLLWVKKRRDADEARREVEALLHMAEKCGAPYDRELLMGPHLLGDHLLVPDIGPEMGVVLHELNRAISSIAHDVNDLALLRRAMVYRQADMIGRAVATPYDPGTSPGSPVKGYKKNFGDALRISSRVNSSLRRDPITSAVSLVLDLLDQRREMWYVDSVPRNMGFLTDNHRNLFDMSNTWLTDFLTYRESVLQGADALDIGSRSSSLVRDLDLLVPRLYQFDLHYNERRQLDGESIANVLYGSRLLDCDSLPFSEGEQEAAFVRYWLTLKYWEEAVKGTDHDQVLLRRIISVKEATENIMDTGEPAAGLDDLSQFGFTLDDRIHYDTMALLRVVRNLDYTINRYGPHYRQALVNGTDLEKCTAEYRLPMVERDNSIHIKTALRLVDRLMGHLYQRLRGTTAPAEGKKLTVYSVGGGIHWYHVMPRGRGKRNLPSYVLRGGKTANTLFTPPNDLHRKALHHFNGGFGDSAEKSTAELFYGQLLALNELHYVLRGNFSSK